MAASPQAAVGKVPSYEVSLNGTPLKDDIFVQSIECECHVGQIPEAVIVLSVGDLAAQKYPEVDDKAYDPGAKLEIKLGYDSKNELVFSGVVVAKRLVVNPAENLTLELRGRDPAIALAHVPMTRFFTQKKDSDVISAVVGEAKGLSADVKATEQLRDQIQNYMTDWRFVRALADRNGYVVVADGGKLTVKEPEKSDCKLAVTLGEDILDLDVQADVEPLIAKSTSASWSSIKVERVEGDGGKVPDLAWGSQKMASMTEVLGDRSYALDTPREIESGDLKTFAEARLMRTSMAAMYGTCTFIGSALAKPNTMLEIKKAGERFNGKAYISGVMHRMSDAEWQTTTYLGLSANWSNDTPAFAAASAGRLATPMYGLQIGTVTELTEDPEGRLRIKVALELIGEKGAEVWARYAQPYASNEAGLQFMPEPGDEVVVSFLDADPQAPIVLGSLHNGKAKQAQVPDKKNTIKTITTRSKLEVRFDDEKKILTLTTPGGHSLTMDDDGKTIDLKDSNGNALSLSSSGIKIEAKGDLQLSASGKVDIKASQDATLAGMNVNCKASTGFVAKGGTTAELSGSAQAKIAGGVVMIN